MGSTGDSKGEGYSSLINGGTEALKKSLLKIAYCGSGQGFGQSPEGAFYFCSTLECLGLEKLRQCPTYSYHVACSLKHLLLCAGTCLQVALASSEHGAGSKSMYSERKVKGEAASFRNGQDSMVYLIVCEVMELL